MWKIIRSFCPALIIAIGEESQAVQAIRIRPSPETRTSISVRVWLDGENKKEVIYISRSLLLIFWQLTSGES